MKYRTMGRTGVQVSTIGLGTRMVGISLDEAQTRAVVDSALELGINFIDTAETYGGGRSEELIGIALEGRRHGVVLGTKTGSRVTAGLEAGGRLTRKRIVEHVEASLRRLRTDYIDIYYFHFPDELVPLAESMRAVDDLVRAGKIRYFALSNHAAWEVAEAAGLARQHGWSAPAISQLAYNMVDRSAEAEMLPACAHFGVSVVPHSPLASGLLTGKYTRHDQPRGTLARQISYGTPAPGAETYDAVERFDAFARENGRTTGELAIAWLLAHPVVCSVIAGLTTREHLDSNAKAADWDLTAAELERIA